MPLRWPAAFMHRVVNSVYGFLRTYAVRPFDNLFSLGLGIFGLLSIAVIAAVILRDPIWPGVKGAVTRRVDVTPGWDG